MKPHILLAVLCGCAALFAQSEVSFAYRGEIELPEGTEARSAEIGDIDHDGCCDMVIGTSAGNILVYEAVAPDSFSFELLYEDLPIDGIDDTWTFASICDFDNDELTDLLVRFNRQSPSFRAMRWYEQTSTNSYTFELVQDGFTHQYGTLEHCWYGCFADVDDNGRIDYLAIYGDYPYTILSRFELNPSSTRDFYWWSGSFNQFQWEAGLIAVPGFGNLDNDEFQDLLIAFSGWVIWDEFNPSDQYYWGVAFIEELEPYANTHNQISLYDIDNDGDDDVSIIVWDSMMLHIRIFENTTPSSVDGEVVRQYRVLSIATCQ